MPQRSTLGPLLFIIYMNDIHTVSDNFNFILYAYDTTLSSPMCSFTRWCNGNIERISTLINSELNKIADWLAVNKLSLNVQKTKFLIFHYRQWVIMENDLPWLMINNTQIERVTDFNFLGFSNEIDVWFFDPFAPPIWNYELGLRMGSDIKITKTRSSYYDK